MINGIIIFILKSLIFWKSVKNKDIQVFIKHNIKSKGKLSYKKNLILKEIFFKKILNFLSILN